MAGAESVLIGLGAWTYVFVFLFILTKGIPVYGTVAPVQAFLFGAGFLARLGMIDPTPLVIAAFAGAYVGDVAGFAAGRAWGARLVDRLPERFRGHAWRLRNGLVEHLGKALLVGHWLGPSRALVPPLAGIGHARWGRFLAWNVLACAIWAGGVVAIGWFFGESYRRLEPYLGQVALVLVALAALAYLTMRWLRRRRRLAA